MPDDLLIADVVVMLFWIIAGIATKARPIITIVIMSSIKENERFNLHLFKKV